MFKFNTCFWDAYSLTCRNICIHICFHHVGLRPSGNKQWMEINVYRFVKIVEHAACQIQSFKNTSNLTFVNLTFLCETSHCIKQNYVMIIR
jgi:hypothetical protein